MIRAAVTAIVDAEHRLGPGRTDFATLAVPLAVSALRRHHRESAHLRRSSVRPLSALQLAIMAAERELTRALRRSPTVAEVGAYLDVAQHEVIAVLETGWSAISAEGAIPPEAVWRHPTSSLS